MTCHPIGSSHILLTTDLSPESRQAFDGTIALAEATGARVTLFHALSSAAPALHGAPLMPSAPPIGDGEEQARSRLRDLAAGLASTSKIALETARCSDVPRGILAYARQHGVDLIAMSTHGRTGLRRLVLGSVAEQVLRESDLPLLLFPLAVKAEGKAEPGATGPDSAMSRIVLATDLSDASKAAFGPTADLAKRLDLPVTLLSILVESQVSPYGSVLGASPIHPDLDAMQAERESGLRELAREFDDQVEVEAVALSGASASGAIVGYAEQHDAGFIAIATHGRSGMRRLLMGSVAESVLRHSHIPVIVFPPTDREVAER